jgi:predicted dehydrogenase
MLKFLIVGFGSIGKRHFDNLSQIGGVEVSVLSRRPIALPGARVYDSLAQALDEEFNAVFITNETALHIPTAIAFAERGRHLFIEKPLSDSLKDVAKLTKLVSKYNLKVMMGYNMRFHPVVSLSKDLLREGRIGRVISARMEAGEYLPDWRPGRDYQNSYSASKEKGGGVILDLSHELDYAYWFFGDPAKVFALSGKRSDLPIETEDVVEILIEFQSGIWCQVHLDYIQRCPSRSFKLIGTEGIMQADLVDNKMRVFEVSKAEWEDFDMGGAFERNKTYVDEVRHFIDCINGLLPQPSVGLEDGIRVLQMALAAKESSRLGRFIEI